MVTQTQTSITPKPQPPSFPALFDEASAPHLGKAEPGLSPVLIPLLEGCPLHAAALEHG